MDRENTHKNDTPREAHLETPKAETHENTPRNASRAARFDAPEVKARKEARRVARFGTPEAEFIKTAPRVARFGTPEAENLDPRHVIGKPHASRARQFMPFMALRGYDELVRNESASTDAETISYERFWD